MFRSAVVCALFIWCCISTRAQQTPCTEAENRRAEEESTRPRDWDALYRYFKAYGRCDDVDAAEGSSESVARILVDHWDTLPRLAELVRGDARFRAFAVGGVNATDDTRDILTIQTKANSSCPAGLKDLCDSLTAQAAEALAEDTLARLSCGYPGELLRTEAGRLVEFNSNEMKIRAIRKVDLTGPVTNLDVADTAIAEMVVGPSGGVVCVRVVAMDLLQAEVEKALRSWTFKRAEMNGRRVAYLGHLEFRLCNISCGKEGMSMTLLK